MSSDRIINRRTKDAIGVALFALGRAGRIHFQNLINSRRAELLYCVEEAVDFSSSLKEKLNLKHVTMLKYSDSDVVFSDER